jgi:hypothetical protein
MNPLAPGRGFAPLSTLLLLAASLACPVPARSQVDLGPVISTEGFGLEVAKGLGPQWRVRVGATAGSYSDDLRAGDFEYDAEADVRWVTGSLDWSPGGGAFHVTLGAAYNDHEIDGEADILTLAIQELGKSRVDQILALLGPGFDIGVLRAHAEFDPISPYVGIGWRSTKERGIGYAFDLGVSHLGVADVSVTVDSDLPVDLIPTGGQRLQEFLDEQEREIEEEAEDYQVYPVVRLQLFYRF